MHYIVESTEGDWLLVEDRCQTAYIDVIGENVFRSVDFATIGRGDGDDVLLMAAGMNLAHYSPFAQGVVAVLTQQAYGEFIERRQRDAAQAGIDFPVEVREEQHG